MPSIGSSTPPLLGTAFDVELSGAFPLSAAILLHGFDVAPLPLGPCTLYPAVPFFVTGTTPTDAAGEGAFTLVFPPTSALTGHAAVPAVPRGRSGGGGRGAGLLLAPARGAGRAVSRGAGRRKGFRDRR